MSVDHHNKHNKKTKLKKVKLFILGSATQDSTHTFLSDGHWRCRRVSRVTEYQLSHACSVVLTCCEGGESTDTLPGGNIQK